MRRKSFLIVLLAASLFLLPMTSMAAEKVTISLWGWKADEEESHGLKAFEKAHPDIKVEYNFVRYADLLVRIKTGFAAGAGPDAMLIEEGFMTMALSPFLEPLEGYAEKEWGADWKDKFRSQPLKFALEADLQGKHYYQLPGFVQNVQIWANMALFKKAGMDTLPKTYDELVQAANKLRGAGITPMITGPADRWSVIDILLPIFDQTAPDMFPLAEAGKISFTEPGFVKGIQVMADMFLKDKIPQEGAFGTKNYPTCYHIFGNGQAAMWPIGSWNMGTFTLKDVFNFDITENFDVFYFPAIEAGGRPSRPVGGIDWGLAMGKDSKYKDEAWELIASHTAGEAMEAWIRYGYFSPAGFKGIDVEPVIKTMRPKSQKVARRLIADLEKICMRRHILYPEIREALIDAAQNACLGKKTAAEVMADVEKVSKRISR